MKYLHYEKIVTSSPKAVLVSAILTNGTTENVWFPWSRCRLITAKKLLEAPAWVLREKEKNHRVKFKQ